MRRLTVYFNSNRSKDYPTTASVHRVLTEKEAISIVENLVETRKAKKTFFGLTKVQFGHKVFDLNVFNKKD